MRDKFPDNLNEDFKNWIFGCDICQDVCPWNSFSKPNNDPLLKPRQELINYTKKDWIELTDEVFKVVFRESPIKRTKYQGLKRNIQYANK